MAVIGFSLLSVLVHTRPVGRVPGISFLILHCLALVLTSGRVEFSKPECMSKMPVEASFNFEARHQL